MSQEIQLSSPPQGIPQTNSWSGPAPTALGPPAPPQTPLAKLHTHLRGRYFITVLIAGVCALMGAAAGIFLPRPGYQSVGMIEIDPRIPSPELADRILPLWQAYVTTVVQNFRSEQLLKEAMNSPEWKSHRKEPPEAYLAHWGKNLVVKLVPNSFIITVTYTDDHKDGKVMAPIAVKSLITAYKDLYGDEQKKELAEKKTRQERFVTVLDQKIADCETQISQLIRTDSEDLQKVWETNFATHTETKKDLNRLRGELATLQAELKQAEEEAKTTPYTIEEFARVDPSMQEMYHIRATLELEKEELTKRLGPNNVATLAAANRLKVREDYMKTYRDELEAKYFIKGKLDGTGGILVKKDLSVEIKQLARLEALAAEQKRDLDDLSNRNHAVGKVRGEKLRWEEDRRKHRAKAEELAQEIEMANGMRIIDPGGQSTIGSDKRIAFGALGFLGGAGIPVGLMLLLSLMNPRFRYSDEATGQHSSGLTLLGILPDLPDRLSDPEQASIAAHCVHQIRTMLQINNGTDERSVFAVTSAAPGDGKTSLTLALGLSYAACGTRTLLIDCDLIGMGLTSRMNVSAADGVLEAIAHRSLLEYVRSTDIADVSILPVGNGQSLHASTLSPAALRRLIEEARKHFDIILIDTGPVLGSIEASLVAAAADAVVLAVSRGQQRPLVEKTIQHLKNIKSNLAGIVFNRAQTADFDSSISGLSLRSTGSGSNNGHSMRMGPVARAVQSAFKPAGEDVN